MPASVFEPESAALVDARKALRLVLAASGVRNAGGIERAITLVIKELINQSEPV